MEHDILVSYLENWRWFGDARGFNNVLVGGSFPSGVLGFRGWMEFMEAWDGVVSNCLA